MSAVVLGGVDFGHLHRFKVSLGLGLIVAGFSVPWLILRDNGVLTIPQSDIAELTPRAQEIVERKQSHYGLLVTVLPIVAVVLIAVGVALIFFGMRGWREIQAVVDRKERAGTELQEEDLRERRLSTEEKLRQDAAQVEEDIQIEEGVRAEAAKSAPEDSSDREQRFTFEAITMGSKASRPDLVQHRMKRLHEVAELGAAKMEQAFASDYDLERDVAFPSTSGIRTSVDLLLRPRGSSSPHLACEIVHVWSQSLLQQNFSNRAAALASFVLLNERVNNVKTNGLILAVFDFSEAMHVRADRSKMSRLLARSDGLRAAEVGLTLAVADTTSLREVDPRHLRNLIERGGGLLEPFGGQLVLPFDDGVRPAEVVG